MLALTADGHSAGQHKDAALVYKSFASAKMNLQEIQLFHSDRDRAFKNELIDQTLKLFDVKRSLNMKRESL